MSLNKFRTTWLWPRLLWAAIVIVGPVGAQNFSGRWLGEENGQKVELVLEQQVANVSGTLILLGASLPLEGRVANGVLSIHTMAGVPLAMVAQTTRGHFEAGNLILRTTQPGEPDSTVKMTRANPVPPATKMPGPAGAPGQNAPAPAAIPRQSAAEFSGRWEAASDDQTSTEVVELEVAGLTVRGTITTLQRGYFSGRVTVKDAMQLQGSREGNRLTVRVWESQSAEVNAQAGVFTLRQGYLVLRLGTREYGFARPGTPLVQSAENSPEAEDLSRAIAGRVYEQKSQVRGRGAMVGGRKRLAICANGSLEYDVSDLASTADAGVDFGNTTSRRGQWSIVLRAGRPVLLAKWQGTGTSYSLTEYFDIVPSSDGQSAMVDGVSLPVTGRCGS